MAGSYDRRGNKNPKWRGGISSLRHAKEILDLPEWVKDNIRKKILEKIKINEESGCWEWIGGVFKNNGRARIFVGKNTMTAATVSFVVMNGQSTEDLCVLHRCDNILCVNPEHLWLGTHLDNSRDMVNKGRQADQNGSKNPHAKLTEEDVIVIKQRLRQGDVQRTVAKDFKVSFQTINLIHVGKTWRHV